MKRFGLLALFVAAPLILAACGGDDESKGPNAQADHKTESGDGETTVLAQQDRDRIAELAAAYVAALRDQDMERAHSHLRSDVPEKAVERAMDAVREDGLQFSKVTAIESSDEGATATVELTDKDGKVVLRYMEFRLDGERWYVYSPQLKPTA